MKTLIETPDTPSEVAASIVSSLKKRTDLLADIEKIKVIEENGFISIKYFSSFENGVIIFEPKHGKLFLKCLRFIDSSSTDFFIKRKRSVN